MNLGTAGVSNREKAVEKGFYGAPAPPPCRASNRVVPPRNDHGSSLLDGGPWPETLWKISGESAAAGHRLAPPPPPVGRRPAVGQAAEGTCGDKSPRPCVSKPPERRFARVKAQLERHFGRRRRRVQIRDPLRPTPGNVSSVQLRCYVGLPGGCLPPNVISGGDMSSRDL